MSALRQSPPAFANANGADGRVRDTKALGYASVRYARCDKPSDLLNVAGRQFAATRNATTARGAVPKRVHRIFARCCPAQIGRVVVGSRAVIVGRVVLGSRRRPMERLANEAVDALDGGRSFATDAHHHVPLGADPRRQNATHARPFATLSTPNAAGAADLIGPANYGAPFFERNRGRDFVSQGAPPIRSLRLGIGMGANPSDPASIPAKSAFRDTQKRESRHPKATASVLWAGLEYRLRSALTSPMAALPLRVSLGPRWEPKEPVSCRQNRTEQFRISTGTRSLPLRVLPRRHNRVPLQAPQSTTTPPGRASRK